MQVNLKDRIALVTGSSRGIGRNISVALAHAGAHIIIVGRASTVLTQRVRGMRRLEHSIWQRAPASPSARGAAIGIDKMPLPVGGPDGRRTSSGKDLPHAISGTTHGSRYVRLNNFVASGLSRICSVSGSILIF